MVTVSFALTFVPAVFESLPIAVASGVVGVTVVLFVVPINWANVERLIMPLFVRFSKFGSEALQEKVGELMSNSPSGEVAPLPLPLVVNVRFCALAETAPKILRTSLITRLFVAFKVRFCTSGCVNGVSWLLTSKTRKSLVTPVLVSTSTQRVLHA